MHQLIDKKKKIAIYLLLLVILSTTNNKIIGNKDNYSITINEINVTGLSNKGNLQVANSLNHFFFKNLFVIGQEEIYNIISEYNIVEEFSIRKIYPSRLNIYIKPTTFIAKIKDNDQLLVGTNGKIILAKKNNKKLPSIIGEFDSKKFLYLKKNIDASNFNFTEIKSIIFYSSNRWDILTIDNILIKLPENNLLNSLDVAHKIIKDNLFVTSEVIDLRVYDRIVIK